MEMRAAFKKTALVVDEGDAGEVLAALLQPHAERPVQRVLREVLRERLEGCVAGAVAHQVAALGRAVPGGAFP